jgi:hypothetical protein
MRANDDGMTTSQRLEAFGCQQLTGVYDIEIIRDSGGIIQGRMRATGGGTVVVNFAPL